MSQLARGRYFPGDPDAPAFVPAVPCVVPAPAAFGDAGADFAGALDPPPLLSAGVFRLDAPAPVAPPVPDELMLVPVPDVPDPLWAPAVDVVSRAAPSAAIASIFMAVPPVEKVEMKAHGFIAAAQTAAGAESAKLRAASGTAA